MTTRRRIQTIGSLGLLLALGMVTASGQERGSFAGWDEIVDPSYRFDPDRKGIRPYQPRAPSEVRLRLERAAELVEQGSINDGLRLFQSVIDDHGHSVLQVSHQRFVGAAEYARYQVMKLPAAARRAYQEWAEVRASRDLREATAQRDPRLLGEIARRWANSSLGQEAMLTCARLEQLEGNLRLARAYALRALDFMPERGEEPPEGESERRARAIALYGLCGGARSVDGAIELRTGGQRRALSEALREVPPPPEPRADEWPTFGGSAERSRLMEDPRGPVRLHEMFALDLTPDSLQQTRQHDDWLNPLPRELVSQPPVQPVRVGERLVVSNSLSVKVFNLYSKSLEWEFGGPLTYELDGYFPVTQYTDHRSSDRTDDPVSKGLTSSVSVARGVVLANLQVPERTRKIDLISRITINPPYPWRGLFAIDLDSGELLWSQRGEVVRHELMGRWVWDDSRIPPGADGTFARLDVQGPPAVVDDRVFALGHFIEGAVNSHLVVADLRTGEPEFSVPLVIGQQELSMFNMPFQEFTSGTPVVGESAVFCPTNLGLMAAVDLCFGDLRWLSAYDAIPISQPPSYYQNNPRTVYWAQNPPIVTRGRLLATPHDSSSLHAFDAATGIVDWQHDIRLSSSYMNRPSGYLVGVKDDKVVVQDRSTVHALDLETGKRLWDSPIRLGTLEANGRGCLTEDHLYIPTMDRLLVFDWNGAESDSSAWPESYQEGRWTPGRGDAGLREGVFSGNVLVFPDMIVSANREQVGVAFDPRAVLADLHQRVREEGESFELLARIASLHRRDDDLEKAAQSFERALSRSEEGEASEVERLRLQLCRTLVEIASEARETGRAEAALESLRRAEGYADDLSARLLLTTEALALGDPARELALDWLDRLRRSDGAERVQLDHVSVAPVSVGAYVALERARLLRASERWEEALEEYQYLHTETPRESFGASTASEYAREHIETLLLAAPVGLRERYDRMAWEEFEAAFEAEDADRLELARRRYPNASRMVEFTARYGRLLRSLGRPEQVVVAGSELLAADEVGVEARPALVEMARAAADLGNRSLARSLIRFLDRQDPAASLPEDLRPLREKAAAAPVAGGTLPALERSTELQSEEILLGARDQAVRGEPLVARTRDYFLMDDYRVVKRKDAEDDSLVWQFPLPDIKVNRWYVEFWHVAGVLIIVREAQLLALDLENGEVLWNKQHEQVLEQIAVGGGLLLTLEEELGAAEEERALVLKAWEPRSGAPIWQRKLARPSPMKDLSIDGSSVCAFTGPQPFQVEVFDSLSGRATFAQPDDLMVSMQVAPYLLDEQQLILVPENVSRKDALEQRISVDRLAARRLGSSEVVWELDLVPRGRCVKGIFPLAGGLGVMVGGRNGAERALLLIEPSSGRVLHEHPIHAFLQTVAVPDGAPAEADTLLCFERRVKPKDGRRVLAVGGDARPQWETTLALPEDTLKADEPYEVLQHGDRVVLLMNRAEAAGKYTDLATLDARSGKELDLVTFPRKPSILNDSSAYLGVDRLFVRIGNELHVFGWR